MQGQRVLLTGASRGIGRGIAVRLAKEGCRLALHARTLSALEEVGGVCRSLGAEVLPLAVDLEEPGSAGRLMEGLDAWGGLDVLINNAGMAYPSQVGSAEVNLERWRALIEVNLVRVMELCHISAQRLISQAKGGAIINIASVAGLMSFAGGGAYCASKHGLIGFSKAMFEDLREYGIKVTAIAPGFVNTDMVRSRGLAGELMIQPEDMAETVTYVLKLAATACPELISLRPQRTPYRKDS